MRLKFGMLALAASAALNAQTLTTAAIQRYFNPIRRNLEASAEAMPADKYDFRLTKDQMSFAEWLLHSVERNYLDCSTLKAEPLPEAGKTYASLKGKEAVSKALKESFAYCEEAMAKMTDQSVTASPQMAAAFLHVIVHNNEIYGNIVGYMRASGIVPPSTAGRGGGNKK